MFGILIKKEGGGVIPVELISIKSLSDNRDLPHIVTQVFVS
jgi:hypothetical protein